MGKHIVIVVLIALLLTAVPAFAQDTTTVTLTEEQVNAALNIAVEQIEQVDALSVDLQDDAVTIDAVVTSEDGQTYTVSITLIVVDQADGEGYYWEVSAASVNGFKLRQSQIDEINAAMQASELHISRTTAETNVLVSVTIEDDSITYDINDDLLADFEFEIPEFPEGFDPKNFDPESYSREVPAIPTVQPGTTLDNNRTTPTHNSTTGTPPTGQNSGGGRIPRKP